MCDSISIEHIALGISILSLAFSIFIGIIGYLQNAKISIANLEAKHFEKIFTQYIVERIPTSVEKIEFVNNQLCAYEDLVNDLFDMVDEAKYYAYAKRDFYRKLREQCQTIEDKLLNKANETVSEEFQQNVFIYEIHEDLVEIIKLINKNYHGK